MPLKGARLHVGPLIAEEALETYLRNFGKNHLREFMKKSVKRLLKEVLQGAPEKTVEEVSTVVPEPPSVCSEVMVALSVSSTVSQFFH